MARAEEEITVLLRRAQDPKDKAARDQLYRVVESELRKLAASLLRERSIDHTLQSTVLIDEAFLRLVNDPERRWENRSQFFRLAWGAMRRILADHGRRRRPGRLAGGAEQHLTDRQGAAPDRRLENEDLFRALVTAFAKLEQSDPEAAETFMLSFFHRLHQTDALAGLVQPSDYPGRKLPIGEVANRQGKSKTTTFRILGRALAFLQAELQGVAPSDS